MKKIYFIIAALLFIPCAMQAQTDVDLGTELGGRLSFGVDKKISRGFHLYAEEELRLDENFSSLNRLQTTVGLKYKVNDYLKVGLGYAMINPYSTTNSAFKNSRHRVMLDVTGSYRTGSWRFSLKERFQLTHRTGDMNLYQNPRNMMALKSRLMVQYKGFQRVEPYAYFELRNTLNAPHITACYDSANDLWCVDASTLTGEAGWFLDGYTAVYMNRLRGALGTEIQLSRHSSLDLHIMVDRVMDYVVDANAEGTKLKSYTYETGNVGWIAAAYTFSF